MVPSIATGSAKPRREGPDLLASRGRYLADLTLPRMLRAAYLLSPHAHARTPALDARGALAC